MSATGAQDVRTLALHGVRVLDLSRLLPGPFATLALADLGAQVDKLEDPQAGDYLRLVPPVVGGMNPLFRALNRGKRSLVLDLKQPAGRALFERLVVHYDVLVESFRPGVMDKLGLGYEALARLHPRLVYCALSGFGATGPDNARAGHDLGYLARAGVLGVTGPAGAPPQPPGSQLADVGSALYAVSAILAALYARHSTGRGRFVDIALTESAAGFSIFALMQALTHAGGARGLEALTGGIAPYRTYATSDGRFVALAIVEPKFWIAFCAAVGIEPDMQALLAGAHQPKHIAELEHLFGSRTWNEWRTFARAHDCCLEVVLSPEELEHDAQLGARGLLVRKDDDVWLRTPLAPVTATTAAPTQGAQSARVLADAGFSDDEVAALVQAGTVR